MAEEIKWITMNGVHIPIMPGQTKDDAVKEFTEKQEAIAKLKDKTSTELADSIKMPSDKWHYPEIDERIKTLDDAFNRATSVNKINAIAKSIRVQEKIVLREIEDIESGLETHGDINALKTLLRKIRMLKRKVTI